MAKDDNRLLVENTDGQPDGKIVTHLQEGAGEVTALGIKDGLASQMEALVPTETLHMSSVEQDLHRRSPGTEVIACNNSFEARAHISSAQPQKTSYDVDAKVYGGHENKVDVPIQNVAVIPEEKNDHSSGDPLVLGPSMSNKTVLKVGIDEVDKGPWQEDDVPSQLPRGPVPSAGPSDLSDQGLSRPKNEMDIVSDSNQAVFDSISPPDFSMLEAMSVPPTTGIASGLVGPLVLKDRFNRWIDATAPIARELTSVAAAKAGISVPGGIKSWLGNSWTTPNKGAVISLHGPPGEHASDIGSSGSKRLSALPVKKGMSVVHSRNASTDANTSTKGVQMGAQENISNPYMERGNKLMSELKQSLKIVLGEVVKGDGKALGDGVYALTLFCGLLDQALAHGLKDGRPRWAAWSSSKTPLSFLNLLDALEQRLPSEPGPENADFRGSLGLDEVRSLNWVRTNAGRLRAWIRQSLNMGLLGARLRLVVEHVDLLQQWYEPWGLLRRDETADELLSIVMALNAVQTNLSVGLGVGLDHQKYALFENLFSLDGSKSGNMMAESSPDRAYPIAEDEPSTTRTTQTKSNLKLSKLRVVSVLEDEEIGIPTATTIAGSDINAGVTDALSPPDSPYDSPKVNLVDLETSEFQGVELQARLIVDANGHEVPADYCLSPVDNSLAYLQAMEVSSKQEASVDEILEGNCSEGRNSDGYDSSERSMFVVESDDDGRCDLSFSHVKHQQPQLNAAEEAGFGHDDWADFEHENEQGFVEFHSILKDTNISEVASTLQASLAKSVCSNMRMESSEASWPVDFGNELVEEAVGKVKGTGRPDLDEYEDDVFSADVAEKASILSDFEGEEHKSEVGVNSLSIVTMELEEHSHTAESPHFQGSLSDIGIAEVHLDIDEVNPLQKGRLSMVHSALVNPFKPSTSKLFIEETVQDKKSQVVNDISRMSSLSESDETHLLEPGSDSDEHPVQETKLPLHPFVTGPQKQSIDHSGNISGAHEDKLEHSGGANMGLEHKAGQRIVIGFEEEGSPELNSTINESTRRKGKIMRLGSKEAEELLQLDLSKLGRAILPSVKKGGTGSKSPGVRTNGVGWGADDLGPDELSRYVETLELKETYLDTILDMEDILLESDDNHGPRALHSSKNMYTTSNQIVDRDGSMSASTSGAPWVGATSVQLPTNHLVQIAWVEVIGARQRRGGASFSERVVGVQEHTVYRILVRDGDSREWEVEHRYRDFVSLYRQLNRMFAANSAVRLPAPWEKVRSESRKLFGNTSPNVVEVRSALIQVCLQSVLQAGPPLSTASPFLRFLFPTTWTTGGIESNRLPRAASEDFRSGGAQMSGDDFGSEPMFSPRSDTTSIVADVETEIASGAQSVFGKTIRLVLQVHKKKSLAQQMHAQHHACAGCYRQLDIPVGLFPGLAQSWGLGGPRWCEYSGQLFCSSCHLNETAVIPANVLQRWDFTLRPVSQLAKAYLDSIYDKPMLCVSAVNPYLYFRVPILAHLQETRKRLSKMLACIRCPSRSRLQAMVGSRRYLLENNDFFALRDLNDLSKGAFAGLPALMNTLSEKLAAHIKRECSICHEMGVSCGAVELCRDPLDIIYPFQEDGIVRCSTCRLPFHKVCFSVCKVCPSCSRGQCVHNLEESEPRDTASTANTSNGVSSDAFALPSSEIGVQVDAHRNSKSTISNFFSGILKPKDSRREVLAGRQDSVILDMTALGPLEL